MILSETIFYSFAFLIYKNNKTKKQRPPFATHEERRIIVKNLRKIQFNQILAIFSKIQCLLFYRHRRCRRHARQTHRVREPLFIS